MKELVIATDTAAGPKAAAEKWLHETAAWRKDFQIEAMGIGSPGPLDCEKGMILETPNLKHWENISFTNFFKKNLGAPSFLENDANCAALGEWHHHKVDDLIVITLGTGVGTGVISSGKLIRGVRGFGVEAGHMTIDMNGPRCECGKFGCFEALVGARLLVARYNQKSKTKIKDLDASTLFAKAKATGKEADPIARDLAKLWTKALAVAVGNLVNIFNPTLISLAGGVSHAFKEYESEFHKILLTEAFDTSLKCVNVSVSEIQEKAGLYGAAVWAKQQL